MPDNPTVAIPNYIPTRTHQADFSGGLGAVGAPHLIGPNEVASTTNVDYSVEWGGASARRGNVTYAWEVGQGVNAINVQLIGRNYALSTGGVWSDNVIPWYGAADSGVTYIGTGTNTTAPITISSAVGYAGGSTAAIFPAIAQYGAYSYIANGTSAFRTNGTNTLDWLLPQADTPTVTFAQQGTFTGTGNQAGAFVGWAGTWTATEGTVTANSTSNYFGNAGGVIVSTCTTTGSRIVIIGTAVTTNWENSITFVTLPTGTSVTAGAGTYTLGGAIDFHQGWPSGDISGATGSYTSSATVTQTLTIGPYGTDYILFGMFDNNAVKISRDLSINDTTFTEYWHAETTPAILGDATTDPISLMLQSVGTAALQVQGSAINQTKTNLGIGAPRKNSPEIMPPSKKTLSIASTGGQISPWGVARPDYKHVGVLPNPDFSNIKAVRVSVEWNSNAHQLLVGGVVTYGAAGWNLNDQSNGISYYQTFARVENNVIVAEGAPSNPSTPQRVQYAYGQLVCASNTNTTAGITHRVFYRTGGLLNDAYRVGSCTITSGIATIYDYNNPDMAVVIRPPLRRFLWSKWPDTSAGTGLPGVNAISEPWNDRIFLGVNAYLYWSYPGQPSQINVASQTTVGDLGDNIQGIIPYNNLVIVKQASVYEMAGTIFEGPNQDWSLQRSGSRRGSAAPKTVIKTPFGILLFGYDGISMYRAGYGIDQDLSWVYDKIGDLWKGTAATDPAAFKGRIPAINQQAIYNSCAAYKDEKIYLAVPTGTNTLPDTMFVLDMPRQKVWMYQYPFKVNSLFWDRVGNRLFAGTDKGTIQQIEVGLVDESTTHVAGNITWSYKTRQWSTPTDVIYENLQVENVGTITASATVDTVGYALNTFTNTSKIWTPCSLQGTTGDRTEFAFNGTQSGTQQEIYQIQWDMVPQAPKVTFFQTDYINVPAENYVKTWLADIDVLSSGTSTKTVTATLFANGTAVTLANGGTSTALVGNVSQGKRIYEISLANPTTAKTVQAIYKSTTQFKYYDTQFEFETKPFEKTTWLVTYKKIGGATQADMLRFYAMDIEGTLTATVTATWIIDGTAFTTNTFTISSANAGETSGVGRIYADQVPLPPGARGYLFQQQLTSTQPFRVWKAHVDIDRIGVKGLSRVTLTGTPTEQRGQ